MRRVAVALLSTILLAACEDGIGIGSSCSAEMREVRRSNGQPDSVNRQEQRGDFTEQWTYFVTTSRRQVYTFRWGASFDRCSVSSTSMNLSPLDD